jgi:hypothetical protein
MLARLRFSGKGSLGQNNKISQAFSDAEGGTPWVVWGGGARPTS